MSYNKKHTGDSVKGWFVSMGDFMNILPNLINASSETAFLAWFEKLELVNRTSLYLYIKKNKDKFPKEYLELAKLKMPKKIWDTHFAEER